MDSLSSFGKVRTMEGDLAAARNKSRASGNTKIPEKQGNMIAQGIKAPVAPIAATPRITPISPPPLRVPPVTRQIPPIPRREMPASSAIPPLPRPAQVPPPSALKPPVTPPLSQKEEKPEAIRPPLPAPVAQPPKKILSILPPRPAAPPVVAKPVAPLAPPRVPEIGKAPSRQDLSRFLPIEEEEGKFMPPAEVKKPPFASNLPEKKTIIPVHPQTVPPPAIPHAGGTPEEILGIKPPAPPAGGFRAATPPLPVTPRTMEPVPVAPGPAHPSLPIPPHPPVYESSYKEKRGLPLSLIAGVAVLVLAVGGLFLWRATHPGAPQQQPPTNITVNPPSPFFTPDSTQIITLQQGRESFLVEQVRALEGAPGNPQSIAYIPIKKSSDNSFLGTKEFFSTMGISLPTELLSDVDNQFMLYLYTPGSEEQTRCATESITNPSCYSPRLGVVLRINAGQETAVQNIMSGLEPTLVQALKPLILDSPAYDKATPWDTATYTGLSISYTQGLPVRFTNLPISTTSLNWTRVGSYLVIATSKNSSYSVLDKVVSLSSAAQ